MTGCHCLRVLIPATVRRIALVSLGESMVCRCSYLIAELIGRKLIMKDKFEPRSLEEWESNDKK